MSDIKDFEIEIKTKSEKDFISIDRKLKKIQKIAEEKKGLPRRYFSEGLIESISEWKEKRNGMIHALMKKNLSSEMLYEIASEGKELCRKLCSKSTCYKRAVEKRKALR